MFAVGSVGRTHKRLVRYIDGHAVFLSAAPPEKVSTRSGASVADPRGFALLQCGMSAAEGDELLIERQEVRSPPICRKMGSFSNNEGAPDSVVITNFH